MQKLCIRAKSLSWIPNLLFGLWCLCFAQFLAMRADCCAVSLKWSISLWFDFEPTFAGSWILNQLPLINQRKLCICARVFVMDSKFFFGSKLTRFPKFLAMCVSTSFSSLTLSTRRFTSAIYFFTSLKSTHSVYTKCSARAEASCSVLYPL